ncbi:Poly(A) RNA polymerase cid14 [Verticillium dahliae]|uniref:polynucleotide adenylyltransferase n=1 Tax=Verticillium dahliae TaxID=27337 RepID=A0A444RS63_VERDA|nr:Poly(A) RNA polymerase cid14 [Verticillium dahliae]RXG44073.1 hypothetical protein VDGE_07308 [Verticillium dahliae]
MSNYRPSYSNGRNGRRDDQRNKRPYYDAPPPPPSHAAPPPPPGPPGRDSWRHRDSDRDYRRPASPRRDSYQPSYDGPRDNRRSDAYNQRDPRPPQGDFNFRFDKPAGVGESFTDSYRPGGGAPSRRMAQPRVRGRGGYRGRARFNPAERELLRKDNSEVQEKLVGEDDGAKYRNIDELSDDEETDMDISDQSGGDANEPSSKRRRRENGDATAGDSAPKWSNPDAETALPPEDVHRKKKDMVAMIRKARMEDQAANKLAASTEAEDFISFDLGDDDDDEEEIKMNGSASNNISGSSGRHQGPQHSTDSAEQNGRLPADTSLPPKPLLPPTSPGSKPRSMAFVPDNSDPLGSRKRTFDDEIKPPSYGALKKVNKMPVRGHVVPEWEPVREEDDCPWIIADHSQTSDMSVWLHKEIVDFYEHVRPRAFEQRMRGELIERIRDSLRRNPKYRGCEVHPFGSYMSGLYLPTADMDIVICSKEWLSGRMTAFPGGSSLYKFRAFLTQNRLADPSSVEVIAKARVPLVKYIDAVTGLRVDISFDRMDGPAAIKTFLNWKEQYPALPILVTIIKHFLAMRGLNEPVNGGIGSFSVSCMVMSMLQLMPKVQSKNLVPEHHLGEMLMEFFDLYGNRFDYKTTAIRINPPGYVRKSSRDHNLTYKNRDRLSIIDPNNSSNDISGGSSNVGIIFYDFHSAHRMIKERMAELSKGGGHGTNMASILETILAGNYSSFRLQRGHLRLLHEKHIGPCDD